ncbi:MAG: hypothetical protein PGN07_03615 [Aeromicrobium erythreum]
MIIVIVVADALLIYAVLTQQIESSTFTIALVCAATFIVIRHFFGTPSREPRRDEPQDHP